MPEGLEENYVKDVERVEAIGLSLEITNAVFDGRIDDGFSYLLWGIVS